MNRLKAFLNGKKTYLGLIATGAIGLAHSLGWIDDKSAEIAHYVAGLVLGIGVVHKADKLITASGKRR